ncbi:MAG: transglutaminase domain-containing protein, partial [Actinomycetota bacterium]
KRGRRERRRTRGAPSQRVAGSYEELLDLARDLGRPVPATATRRELAAVVALPGAPALATRADVAVFGPDEPTDEEVDAAWAELTTSAAAVRSEQGTWERVRTAVNPTSLRGRR